MAPTDKKRLLLLCGASLLTLQIVAAPLELSGSANGLAAKSAHAQDASCFVAGTLVLMADGSERPIEALRPGDVVLGRRGRVNRVVASERTLLGRRRLYAFNGRRPFVTAEHPFLTSEGWKALDPEATRRENDRLHVAPLQLGDRICRGMARRVGGEGGSAEDGRGLLFLQSATVLEALAAVEDDPKTPLFNLLLDGDHSYVADGWIVHNKEGDRRQLNATAAGSDGGGSDGGGSDGGGSDGGGSDGGGSDGGGSDGGGSDGGGSDGGGSDGGGSDGGGSDGGRTAAARTAAAPDGGGSDGGGSDGGGSDGGGSDGGGSDGGGSDGGGSDGGGSDGGGSDGGGSDGGGLGGGGASGGGGSTGAGAVRRARAARRQRRGSDTGWRPGDQRPASAAQAQLGPLQRRRRVWPAQLSPRRARGRTRGRRPPRRQPGRCSTHSWRRWASATPAMPAWSPPGRPCRPSRSGRRSSSAGASGTDAHRAYSIRSGSPVNSAEQNGPPWNRSATRSVGSGSAARISAANGSDSSSGR